MHAIERTHRAMVLRIVSIVADTATGASKRNENGFSRPPVRYKSAASCRISNARNAAALRTPSRTGVGCQSEQLNSVKTTQRRRRRPDTTVRQSQTRNELPAGQAPGRRWPPI